MSRPSSCRDALFAEAFRVLRPGGVFAGSDSVASLRFRLLHIRDICNTVPPETCRIGCTRRDFMTSTSKSAAAGCAGAHSSPNLLFFSPRKL